MLKVQKRIAAQILKCGKNRVGFDPARLEEIKEAITKIDLRGLIKSGAIYARDLNNTSKFHARERKAQKSKGKQKGHGSRKGKATARLNPKREWMNKVRLQRKFLKDLKLKKYLDNNTYRMLYGKIKGGFFRSAISDV